MAQYGNCHKCRVSIEERRTTRECRMKGKLIMLFVQAPTRVCPKCREEFRKGEIAYKMEAMALEKERPKRVTLVSHVSFGQ